MAETALATRMPEVLISAEQSSLIQRTIAKDATLEELQLFFSDCKRRGVHPLDKLIHFTKRGGKYTPITSIDFMRTRAHDSGECAGISDPTFDGEPGKAGFSARVIVRRLVQAQLCDFSATARWSEYCPPAGQDHMWRKMPHTMLGKCAEALALRKAFPQQLQGLYAREEMDQADVPTVTVRADMPERSDQENGLEAPSPAWSVPVPPEGYCYITQVITADTSNKNVRKTTVTFSDGESYGTINQWLASLAEQCAQDHVPVRYDIETKGKYTNLKALTKYEELKPLAVREPGDDDGKIF